MMTDDDAAVFADQLEQQGEIDHANLIRLQRVRGEPWDRAVIEAAWECEGLIARHGDAWRAELPSLPGVIWGEFREGFVATAQVMGFRRLWELADQIRAASPSMHEITVMERTEPSDPAPDMPWLRTLKVATEFTKGPIGCSPVRSLIDRVPELVIEMTSYDVGQGQILARSLTVPKYRFAMTGEHIGGRRLAQEIVESPAMQELHALELGTKFVDFNYHYFGNPTLRLEGATTLASGTVLRSLEVLDLTRQRITDAGFAQIGPQLENVTELRLGVTDLTTIEPLCDGPALTRLDLYYNKISPAVLSEHPRLAELRELGLDTCELIDLGDVIRAPAWQTLRSLDVSRNGLGRAVTMLSSATVPPHLHTLRLASCDLNAAFVDDLARVTWLDQLIELSLDEAPVTAALLARLGTVKKLSLAKCTGAPITGVWNATHLDLSHTTCELPDHAPNLQTLELRNATVDVTKLTVAAFPRLRRLDLANVPLTHQLGPILELCPQLETLTLRGCGLDAADVAQLAERGVGTVRTLDLRGHFPWTWALYQLLAKSRPLYGVKKFLFQASSWQFPQAIRDELDARFGMGWGWLDDDEDRPDDAEGA